MQIRLLLGPAGSGKTFRCLAEARRELKLRPAGPPLLLIAPKQTTFQLERQLLTNPDLIGYTRLHILSFDRLAYFLFDQLRQAPPALLAEEGRVMVLRAILARKRERLKVFRASARLTGFATQLSELVAELQRTQLTPQNLQELAARLRAPEGLAPKLEDLAGLLQDYLDWLQSHKLQDGERLLSTASELIRANPHTPLAIDTVWVDGFAEWSPQELELLTLLLPKCRRATLTFSLDQIPTGKVAWLSAWSAVSHSFEACRKRLQDLPGITLDTELLPRDAARSRFAASAALRYLERHWDDAPAAAQRFGSPRSAVARRQRKPGPVLQADLPGWETLAASSHSPPPPVGEPLLGTPDAPPASSVAQSIRVARCIDPDGEAAVAAREILRHVRAGGRYHDVAVLVRKLELYHDSLQRIFSRYQIPFFMDRRESVAHHPLAELTRSALRTLLTQWKHDDWFAALKTGLVPCEDYQIDELENEALARGWKGTDWHQPLRIREQPGEKTSPESLRALEERLEALRKRLLPPFQKLAVTLGKAQNKLTGSQLATALREFWQSLHVERQLVEWAEMESRGTDSGFPNSVHLTVWEQMNEWLENLTLAFSEDSLTLREWLPILETGLASLNVGAIPPALDQVLIGSIERSRNPDIKLALLLGLNETVFPAPPEPMPLLTESDRMELEQNDLLLASSPRRCLSRERYYAYIAFTRAREQIVLTSSVYDATGAPLNPSPFLNRLRDLFPSLETEVAPRLVDWRRAEHPSEVIGPLLAIQALNSNCSGPPEAAQADWRSVAALPELKPVLDRLRQVQSTLAPESLSPDLAQTLYGPTLRSSVSRLEEFAACPFKFFVNSGLRAEERKTYELDAREQGSFQHEVLAEFHRQLRRENKKWRELTPAEARERIGTLAGWLMAGYRDGLLQSSEESRFLARVMTESLKDFIETLVGWMNRQYEFDPVEVELPFGYSEAAPAWRVDLGEGRLLAIHGRIDRIDLYRVAGKPEAWCLVIDYKSRAKRLDPVLIANGLQLQLLTYLNVLRDWPAPKELFGSDRLIPAGVFYVNLRGKYEGSPNRAEALSTIETDRKEAYRHVGRFDISALPMLDSRKDVRRGDQFSYRLTNSGEPHKGSREALSTENFRSLLESAENQLRRMGREILAGNVAVDPYRKGSLIACEHCSYRAVCRVDPWTQSFRLLKAPKEHAG